MALTTEQLLLQADILASKTDATTNPNMVYKALEAMNKGLNPDFFAGNKTKIVNAINTLATQNRLSSDMVQDFVNKLNGILMDTSGSVNEEVWKKVQSLMGKDTIIEGLGNILEANTQEQILGLTEADVGKVLSIEKDEAGKLRTKAIEVQIGDIVAGNVSYHNTSHPELTNVAQAIDFLLENGGASGPVNWNDIINKPQLADNMTLTTDALVLKSGDIDLSTIAIVNDADIDTIFETMNKM